MSKVQKKCKSKRLTDFLLFIGIINALGKLQYPETNGKFVNRRSASVNYLQRSISATDV